MEDGPAGLSEPITLGHAAKLSQLSRQSMYHAVLRGRLKVTKVTEDGPEGHQKTSVFTTAQWVQDYLDTRNKLAKRSSK